MSDRDSSDKTPLFFDEADKDKFMKVAAQRGHQYPSSGLEGYLESARIHIRTNLKTAQIASDTTRNSQVPS